MYGGHGSSGSHVHIIDGSMYGGHGSSGSHVHVVDGDHAYWIAGHTGHDGHWMDGHWSTSGGQDGMYVPGHGYWIVGHSEHGQWVEGHWSMHAGGSHVHIVDGATGYWIAGHSAADGQWVPAHWSTQPGEAVAYVAGHGYWVAGHTGQDGQSVDGHWVMTSTGHMISGGHAISDEAPEHIIEKNYYTYHTKTHVIHDPVKVPGRVISKTVKVPAEPLYNCFQGYHSWMKTLWKEDQQKYCCYKYKRSCVTKTLTQYHYHTVVHNKEIPVPVPHAVPVPMAPPAPEVIKVPVRMPPPPRKVIKVPVPVMVPGPEPEVETKIIKYPKPVPVPVTIHREKDIPTPVKHTKIVHFDVPVPSPPKVVYHDVKVNSYAYECEDGLSDWKDAWSHSKRLYCCWKTKVGCPHSHTVVHTKYIYHTKEVPRKVNLPPKIIYKEVTEEEHHKEVHLDCHSGYSNWYYGWSSFKKDWCCSHEQLGCPGTWKGFAHGHAHGHWEAHGHIEAHGHGHVGIATGRIYDCQAGFNNWLHGWSDSKKHWCCQKESKGCVPYNSCDDDLGSWSSKKQEWCCGNFQKGCPHTTLSPLGCDAPCTLHGETSVCKARIHWTANNVFQTHGNPCALAYSKVQVECDVCRACSIAAAGCEVSGGAGSEPYDCNAALNNFFRAWSPEKKKWCCGNKYKGCEGNSPPGVDPGAGMMWKHVQVNGYWTWVVAGAAGGGAAGGAAGGGVASLPYDCHVGLVNWKIGWSDPKKGWCCTHQKLGCPGMGGGGGGGAVTTHSYHVHYSSGGGGGGGGGAAGGGSWHSGGGSWHSGGGSWSSSGGVTHHYHVHHDVHVIHHNRRLGDLDGPGFDCTAANGSAWPQEKRDFCCKQDPSLCE
ncbi:unnamed protein product [Effrenium voratum]|uniref:Uncharacterized protein n=1 Tax=Effrenium voratum TaxID=2562239 RepID=A0AA36IU21_9DINO|nr:unnamed protein product [Effrenium voratum]